MPALPFERFAGLCALLAGISSFLYALVFLVLHNTGLSALVLLLVGLLSAAALVAVYLRLHETDAAFALWAFLLSVTGALGSAIHGGYDLALALHPVPSMAAFPNPIDPRGLLNFGVAGLGVALLARLIVRGHRFLPRLGYLGYVAAILLLILYPTCAPYQHDADLGPGGDLMHDRLQGFHLGQIFGVQDLGSVEGYRRQRCVDVQQDWLLIHVASELLPRRGAQ